jgi:hypothetical protein
MADRPSERSHWNAYAARWSLIGAPLRPCSADIEYVSQAVRRLLPPSARPERALLLGVTPELAQVDWQPPLEVLAVDRSVGMVEGVWPGDTATRRARVADWLELDEPDGAFALVLGDGVFTLLQYPSGYARLTSSLARLTRSGGLLCLRAFCRPLVHESVDAVFAALDARQIGNFHVFKWRLAMALQGEGTHGVELDHLWRVFSERALSVARFAERSSFPEAEVGTIEGYRGMPDRYSFSSEAEVVAALESAFELVETWRPEYELGERCLHLTLRRR